MPEFPLPGSAPASFPEVSFPKVLGAGSAPLRQAAPCLLDAPGHQEVGGQEPENWAFSAQEPSVQPTLDLTSAPQCRVPAVPVALPGEATNAGKAQLAGAAKLFLHFIEGRDFHF